MSAPRIGIVGAGIAGLTAARHLVQQGFDVRVFDKARGPGGRMSTRRTEGFEFDHGAQYFTARGDAFRRALEDWRARGVAGVWSGRWVQLQGGRVRPAPGSSTRYVGTPRMNALCHDLGRGIQVHYATRVAAVTRAAETWSLVSEDGRDLGRFDYAVLTLPAAQAARLLQEAPALADAVTGVTMAPCWAVMAAFDAPLRLGWDAAFVGGSPLAWVARNASKPGRPPGETWVLHGAPEWSREHAALEPAAATEALLAAFFQAVGAAPREPRFVTAHAWRYAKCETPLAAPFLLHRALGVCGDWCLGDRVEDAFSSALALAQRIQAG